MIDKMRYSDEYETLWEFHIRNLDFSLDEVNEIYRNKLISEDDYNWAVKFLKGECL